MKIKLLSSKIEVLEVNAQDLALLTDNNQYCIGRCDHSTQKIWLNRDLHPYVKRATLMHELAHLVIDNTQMEKKIIDAEKLCDFIGTYADEIVKATKRYFNEK